MSNDDTPDQAELREKLLDYFTDGAPSFAAANDTLRAIATRKADDVMALIAQQPSSQAIERGDEHEILMAYAVECEKNGALSKRATEIRMNLATHFRNLNDRVGEQAIDIQIYEQWLEAMGEECWYDHNGNCQAHFIQPVDECVYRITKDRIAALKARLTEPDRSRDEPA